MDVLFFTNTSLLFADKQIPQGVQRSNMRSSSPLQILMWVCMTIALAGIVGCTPKFDQTSQGLCVDNAPCAGPLGCSDANGNFECVGGQLDPAQPCVLNGACNVVSAICQSACGQALYCGSDNLYHDVPGSVCNPPPAGGSGGMAGSGGAPPAGGSGGAPPVGGAGGSPAGGSGGSMSCIDQYDGTPCTGYLEGDTTCTGALTCHCGWWLETVQVPYYSCVNPPSGGAGGTAGSGGAPPAGGSGGAPPVGGAGGSPAGGSGGTAAAGSGGAPSAGAGGTPTAGSGGMAGSGGAVAPNLCYAGNMCSPDSTNMWESICFEETGQDLLRCCGGVLIVSSLSSPCPAGSGGAGGTGGSGGAPPSGNVEFRWTMPAGYVQSGAVSVIGQSELGGVVTDNWSTVTPLCTMSLAAGGYYSCFVNIPSGSVAFYNGFHVDPACAPYNGGWMFDEETYACGSCPAPLAACCGQEYGSVEVYASGVLVSDSKVDNGDGKACTFNKMFTVP
jgi:hypothetical protein